MRHLLDDERVRKTTLMEQPYYSAVDLLALLTDDSENAAVEWEELKGAEPVLRQGVVQIELAGSGEPEEVMPLAGVMRLIQAVDSPRAERLRGWLPAEHQ